MKTFIAYFSKTVYNLDDGSETVEFSSEEFKAADLSMAECGARDVIGPHFNKEVLTVHEMAS